MNNAAMVARMGSPLRRLLLLLLVIALPLLVFEVLGIVQLRQAREAETHQEASRLLDLVEAEQQRLVEDVHHLLVTFTELGVGAMDPGACQGVMERIKGRFPPYMSINVASRDGRIWCSTEPSARGENVADRPYRQEALSTGEVVIGTFIRSRTTGRPSIPIARAYRGADGELAGTVAVLLDITWLEDYLVHKSLPENSSILVADRAGTIVARVPEIVHLPGTPLPDRLLPLLKEPRKGTVERTDVDGVARVIAYSPLTVGVPNLFFQVSLDKDTAMRAVNLATLRSLGLFLGVLTLTGLAAYWGLKRFLRLREQAQQNALRIASILASTVDGVVELDRDWRFVYMNDNAKHLITEGRDLSGQTLWDAFPELVDTPLWDKAHQAMTEQTPTEAEFQGVRTSRWFWMRAFPSAGGLAVYLLDITRRRAAEEELRDSKDRLSLALDSAQAGTFDWNLIAGTGHWSEEGYRLFGLDPLRDPADNATWNSIVHPEDREKAAIESQTQLIEEKRTHFRMEYRVLPPGGQMRWISCIGRVEYNADGKPQRISGLNIDITERKAMEEALLRTEERLTIALAAAEAGLWDFDVRNGTLIWSDGMYRLYGVDPTHFTPSEGAFYALVHPDDREAVQAYTGEVMGNWLQEYRIEFRIHHPVHGLRWILAIGRPILSRGRPVRLAGLNIDITERKAMEQALREAKSRADDANLSKSKFLAAASHDLRQPLQSALLFAGVLQRHVAETKGQGALFSLERALDTLKSLLDSLLDVSRLDAGVIVPQPVDMPLGPLLDELDDAYRPIAASKGLAFRFDGADRALSVHSDRLLLGRMLRNLVENAIRYTEAGQVWVTCTETDGTVRIAVHDTGIGISSEHLAKVFEEFHQVGNPERDRNQGLGLGLAIVQRLSRLLNHPVTLRSEPEKGSVFAIDVPRALEAADAAPSRESAESGNEGLDRLAVLIDDDVIVLMGLRTIFRDWGYDVLVAGSADQALERLRVSGRVPDLIVADYRLREGKVGTDAILLIREEAGQPVPGIILTGEISGECENEAERHGLPVVHKPVTPRHLHTAVRALLDPVP